MISYAQNFEDVFLERCFSDIARGFYIDVGASHPIRDSATYWFYRKGWYGLNIDASDSAYQLLQRYRPRDINEKVLAGNENTQVEFFDSGMSGLSSVNQRLADHAAARGFAFKRVLVQGVTLDYLCEKHGVKEIDFLKIDAEGHEPNVLRGFKLERWRPKVVVVEAIDAITARYSNEESVALLAAANYTRSYFDGLNDYFLSPDAEHLKAHFASPISVLDGVERWSDYQLDTMRASIDAVAWMRVHNLRLRQRWAEFTQDDEIEWEYRRLVSGEDASPTAAIVHKLYADLLARSPSPQEIEYWMGSASSMRDLVGGIIRSDEYCRKSLEWSGL